MDPADDGDNDGVFIYMGGDQEVPEDVTYVRIHKSVKIIHWEAFCNRPNLVSIEMHDGVEIIEKRAFNYCISLRRINLPGVRVIEEWAFNNCTALESVEFGNKLQTIGQHAFYNCNSLKNIKIPNVRIIGERAFQFCTQLTEVELSEDLGAIEECAVITCTRLRRIAIPLKNNMLRGDYVFYNCDNLSQVDLVGGVHKTTVASLLLDSWRNEMNALIDRINRDLPNTGSFDKTTFIRQQIERFLQRLDHYKSKHYALLKEFTTLLELALWKAKLDEDFGEALSREDITTSKKAKIDTKAARQEKRITSGANVVIKNVLPFLKLE